MNVGLRRQFSRTARRRLGLALLLAWLSSPSGFTAEPMTPDGFPVPAPGRVWTFPRAHGNHPEFKLEWWYVTGHLWATNPAAGAAERFGYQATFFRRAAPKSERPTAGTDSFGDQQLYLAHMALLETRTGRFTHEERLNREGWDAASASNTLAVRNGNWSLQLLPPPAGTTLGSTNFQLHLQGGLHAQTRFDLTLQPLKPLVFFGSNGVSRKAAEPTATSHYLTFTRLATSGTLTRGTEQVSVVGDSWMDHEISSSQLGAGQIGWDWACLQLQDGREIMVYRLRRDDGSTDPFSTLAWIDAAGRVAQQSSTEFQFEPQGEWKSPRSAGRYPARVRLAAGDPETGQRRVFVLEPLATDQELLGGRGGLPYWEGACDVRTEEGRVVGRAFLEMTGYAGNLRSSME